MSVSFFECFSRSGDEQRLSSLSIDRRCPRQVGVPSGTFAALANPGERGLTAPYQVSLVFLVLPANQQFAWTDGNVARESQHNTVIVNISVNTSCVESFRARKQIFQKFYTLYIFRKTIFLCQKLDQTLIFSLPTLFFHFKHRCFFSRNNPYHFKWARAWAHVRCRGAMT